MKKHLFYSFIFVAVFASSPRVFSTNINFILQSNLKSSCVFNFSKSKVPLYSIDLITDSNFDDEENLITCATKFSTILPFIALKNSNFSLVHRARVSTFSYSIINLSRIPRFNFLSLSVLRI